MVAFAVAARGLFAAAAGIALHLNYLTISIMTLLPDANDDWVGPGRLGASSDTSPRVVHIIS
jgi:hypothetical protein